MSARDDIIGGIRRARGRGAVAGEDAAALEARLARHPRGPAISRVALDPASLVDLFERQALAAAATVARVPDGRAVPAALADYLVRENLPAQFVLAPDPELDAIPWRDRPLLAFRRGRARDGDMVSVTGAFAGVAETGTLMLLSGPDSPTTLNLLPETHVVVLPAAKIVGPFEDAFDRLRNGKAGMPRTVNFITGPSRSADIGQQLQMGAHGPRRLHILLIGDAGV